MQWVVTTGRTIDAAKERALDALGIDASELDFEVLAEPSSSLFGLRTTDAKVRARVRPTRPRPKLERRNRKQRRDGKRRRKGRDRPPDTEETTPPSESVADRPDDRPAPRSGTGRSRRRASQPPPTGDTAEPQRPELTAETVAPKTDPSPVPASSTGASEEPQSTPPSRSRGTRGVQAMSDISLDEQEPTALDFVTGLVEAFGLDADVSADREDEEAIEIHVEGDDLGLLVGPRGTTLASIAELTRTAVAQQHAGRLEGRLRVDVAGYRARRKEALVRFVHQIADKVIDTGEAIALEPMSPPDRKIVHDAVNEIDGVYTESRGEDRRRHVVILADS